MARSRLATTLVALPIIAALVALGTWQVQRLAWKRDLIATMETRLAAGPVPLDEALVRTPEEREWQRVMVAGHFEHDREVALYRLSVDGDPGYLILTPLRLADGRAVLVDRGHVPGELVEASARPGSEPEGMVWVTGVLRGPERPNAFTNPNDPERRAWFWIDLPALEEDMGLDLLPVVVHADPGPAGSWPRGGQAIFRPANNHLQYAVTWYGLAAVALVFYVLLLRRRPDGGQQP